MTPTLASAPRSGWYFYDTTPRGLPALPWVIPGDSEAELGEGGVWGDGEVQ